MLTWKKISLRVPPSHHDLLIALLSQLGITGFVQSDDGLEFYVPSARWTPTLRRQVGYALQRSLRTQSRVSGRMSVETILDQNWNAVWERSVRVTHPTKRITIRPSWRHVRPKAGQIVLTIDPKMSFGTGHHETTRICLRLLEEFLKKGDTVLDVGTGTGILAIAAAKLGAKAVLAVDNDPWSVDNAEENVRQNRESRSVTVRKASVAALPARTFAVVVANIDDPTIRKNFGRLLNRVRKGGLLILSGLMLSDLARFLRLIMKKPVEPVLLHDEGEWFGVVLRKNKR